MARGPGVDSVTIPVPGQWLETDGRCGVTALAAASAAPPCPATHPRRLADKDQMKILKIDSLDKGWSDKDNVMLHAAFQLLIDFVEKERPGERMDWSASPEFKHAWKEILSLYRWWTQTRPARKGPLHDKTLRKPPIRWKKVPRSNCRQLIHYNKTKYPEYRKAQAKQSRLEKEWEEEDQRNLHRLVDIRGFLWT